MTRTGISLVGVHLQISFGEVEVTLVNDLVEGGLAAGQKLASDAMAEKSD